MRTFVESMKRLYKNGKVTREKIEALLSEGKLTDSEAEYILED